MTATRVERTEYGGFRVPVSPPNVIREAAVVVEQIVERVLPGWTERIHRSYGRIDRWDEHVEAAQRAKIMLERQTEPQEKLGEIASQLDAVRLHPWVWESARSFWKSGRFREAVRAAAVKWKASSLG
jgi:uncharacterized membrane protein YccC